MINADLIKSEVRRIVRFGSVGVVVALIYYVISVGVVATKLGTPLIATTVGTFASVFASYFGHLRFTFGVESNHQKRLWRYALAALLAYGLNLFLTWLLIDKFRIPYPMGFAIVVGAIALSTYILGRWWIFVGEPHSHSPGTT